MLVGYPFCELSFIGQNEDYSLGDSLSDSFEKLPQRAEGKVSIDMILVIGKYMQSSTYFSRKFLLVL